MAGIFNTYLYEPILSVLVFIYNTLAFHDLGVAIILLTIVVRIVLLPLFYKGTKDQTLMQHLQPHIKKIQLDHKDDKEKQARAMMDLYKKYKLNPFSGFLLILVQLPLFIALFQIFSRGLAGPQFDTHTLLGLINLGDKNVLLAIIAAIAQYFQTKMAMPAQSKNKSADKDNPMASMGKTMQYVGPFVTFFILMNLPAALGVYWIVSTGFSIVQQMYVNKRLPPLPDIQ